MDGIELEILWSNLISIVSEQAKALRRIAFSPIVREAGDLANALFDRRGRMVAQAVTGTPGHINSLAAAGKHFVEAFPTQTISPGDVLITNDPWLSAGHFFDITVMLPAFEPSVLDANPVRMETSRASSQAAAAGHGASALDEGFKKAVMERLIALDYLPPGG